jgi:hypothetical protein
MKMMSLLNSVKKQPYLNMFRRKRSNKGVMWASLISLGVSTLVMMLGKGQRKNVTSSFQNFTKNISAKGKIPMMNNAALSEFSEEFLSKNVPAGSNISTMNDEALTEFSEDLVTKAIENK